MAVQGIRHHCEILETQKQPQVGRDDAGTGQKNNAAPLISKRAGAGLFFELKRSHR